MVREPDMQTNQFKIKVMKLSAEKIQANWMDFMSNIDTYISSPRKEQLTKFL